MKAGYITAMASLVFFGVGCQNVKQLPHRVQYGVALTPSAFDGPAVERFLAMVPEAGGVFSWAGEGMQLLSGQSTAYRVLKLSRERTWTPVIVTGSRSSILKDAEKRSALGDALVDFAKREQPPYLGIGNEINFIYKDKETRDKMVSFFEETTKRVKRVSPHTKVFPVFQLEWMKGYRAGLLGGSDQMVEPEWDLIERFEEADFIAFTSYPSFIFQEPKDIPENYFSDIARHVNKRVAFTEIGWYRQGPDQSAWESSSEEQAEFIKRFPQLSLSLNPVFVIWPFVHDQQIGPPLEYMGFMPSASSTSLGWEAWKEMVQSSLDKP